MPGEEKEIQVVFGISSSCEEACSAVKRYADAESTEREFAEAEAYNYEKISSLSVKTPDQKINHMMNNWVKKQADFVAADNDHDGAAEFLEKFLKL